MNIPDAPWIQAAERRGTDYMYGWLYGEPEEYEDEEDGEDDGD